MKFTYLKKTTSITADVEKI